MTPDDARRLQDGLAAWARIEPGCRALALVGSWVRGAARPDSDLDLMLLATDRDHWAANDGWLRQVLREIGFASVTMAPETYGVTRAWRASLGPQIEVEVGIADQQWAGLNPLDAGTQRVVRDGLKPLVDKDGLLRALVDACDGEP
ncbi:nucleotidyltransferase domain-containing protein [Phenylobacterium kunshanense]|uniref:Nucleotidyltransferase domain-containing protein n=1 Tax=Phenylobacterium kunshanense TaxID=1445034 RepID=A0A328BPL6_9CAUL|nr:nucleotidyltransferase domain-containing protein [Phenylobacterium kunshanense]RAK69043.1 nucleotidyltransferase domain-containing protein [Phenylobacterium kunshanense]